MYILREFVRTHVILTPGACWGGSVPQSVARIWGIRGIRLIRGWNYVCAFLLYFTIIGDSGGALVQCFFDFFMTAPSRMPTLKSFSGQVPSRNAHGSRHSIRSCHEKVSKNIER